jgi:hypothetical protein
MRHTCGICYRSYSRLWVLKRHVFEQHGIQYLGDSTRAQPLNPGGKNNLESLIQMMMMYDRTVKERPVESGDPADATNLKARKLAIEMMKPFYNNMKKELSTLRNWLNLYVPFPKVLVSGFSCYLCPLCLAQELSVPIKDRGVDLTCEGRHRCRAGSPAFDNVTLDRNWLEIKLANYMFAELNLSIDRWIPGKKLIFANKITVPGGKDNETIRKYVRDKYDIPKKNNLVDVNVKRSRWLPELFCNGKIEPTSEQLDDFCAYCLGTYAIFRIRDWDLFEYYAVFLASAESTVKQDSYLPL